MEKGRKCTVLQDNFSGKKLLDRNKFRQRKKAKLSLHTQ